MLTYSTFFAKTYIQAENGKLPTGEKVKVKISGDGARMTRLTNFVILSYCVLDESEDVLAAKGYIYNSIINLSRVFSNDRFLHF